MIGHRVHGEEEHVVSRSGCGAKKLASPGSTGFGRKMHNITGDRRTRRKLSFFIYPGCTVRSEETLERQLQMKKLPRPRCI